MRPTNEKLVILEIGKTEFLRFGFQKVSLRSIAASAKVTTGAIYNYYKDKEAIFDALVATPAEYRVDLYTLLQMSFLKNLQVNS